MRPLAALLAAAALAAAALPGCIDGDRVVETGSLVLTLTLRNTGGGDREGGLGPHCATASVRQDRVVVLQESTAEQRRHPVLVVDSDHDWQSGWLAVSTDPFALPLDGEAAIRPHVDGREATVARVAWDGEAPPLVDGVPVELPASWTYRSPDGQWEADLRLDEGPRTVAWWGESRQPCA